MKQTKRMGTIVFEPPEVAPLSWSIEHKVFWCLRLMMVIVCLVLPIAACLFLSGRTIP